MSVSAMWSEGDPRHELREHEASMGRTSAGSEVVVMDERVLEAAARAQPGLTNINVTKSSRLHIGPKFVSVTQNVDNTEVVKVKDRCDDELGGGDHVRLLATNRGEPRNRVVALWEQFQIGATLLGRILGLELVSPQNTKRLRCSIAVFVCWAFVVASALTFFIFYFALATQDKRLDLDLPLPKYLWDIAKSTTRAERLLCAAAMIALFACIMLIVYFTAIVKKPSEDVVDVAPHEWYINRDMWLAPPFDEDEETTDRYDPLRLVIIAHTVSPECNRFINCAAELRNLQSYYAKNYGYDLPYNFMIGNDGRVYEARGWNKVGAHTQGYNRCSLGLAFIGDYREGLPSYAKVTPLQLERAKMLLDKGVKLGHLHPSYHVLGAKDLKPTASPGANLHKAIQMWSHYDHENLYYKKSCEDILNMYQNQTDSVGLTATLKPILKESDGNVL